VARLQRIGQLSSDVPWWMRTGSVMRSTYVRGLTSRQNRGFALRGAVPGDDPLPVEERQSRAPHREDRVDGVLGVAQPQPYVVTGVVVGAGVVAIVGVQDRVAAPGQVVLLAHQSLAGHIDGWVEVAVQQDQDRERPVAPGTFMIPEMRRSPLR